MNNSEQKFLILNCQSSLTRRKAGVEQLADMIDKESEEMQEHGDDEGAWKIIIPRGHPCPWW